MIDPWNVQNRRAEYVVNKEKRTVVCFIQISPLTVARLLNKYLYASGLDRVTDAYAYPEKPFIGIAKCHPNDEWNEEVGKRLARDRAEKNLQNTINTALTEYAEKLKYAADLIEKYGVKK